MHAFIYNFLATYMLLHRCDLDLCGLFLLLHGCVVFVLQACAPPRKHAGPG